MRDVEIRLDQRAIDELAYDDEAEDLAQEAGDEVAEIAADLAPKNTGAMAASIHAQTGKDHDGVYADVSWEADKFYGLFSEVGTEHQAPQPFLRPALDQAKI